jgi:hypothetical protein
VTLLFTLVTQYGHLSIYSLLTTCWASCLPVLMMASFIFYLSASILFASSTVASDCSREPIYVDIHKRAVHNSPVFQYGSFIGLGTPPQNQSLWPSLAQNHTSLASQTFCNQNSTLKNCDRSTGGFFDHNDSTS